MPLRLPKLRKEFKNFLLEVMAKKKKKAMKSLKRRLTLQDSNSLQTSDLYEENTSEQEPKP